MMDFNGGFIVRFRVLFLVYNVFLGIEFFSENVDFILIRPDLARAKLCPQKRSVTPIIPIGKYFSVGWSRAISHLRSLLASEAIKAICK